MRTIVRLESRHSRPTRHYIIQKGQVVWSGDSDALLADQEIKQRYLGL